VVEQLFQAIKAHLLPEARTLEGCSPGGLFVVTHPPQAQQVGLIIARFFPTLPRRAHDASSVLASPSIMVEREEGVWRT
jgi:hypothetical protein